MSRDYRHYSDHSDYRKKKKFKIGYVILGLLVVIIAAFGILVGTHWDLVRPAITGLTHSGDEIAAEAQRSDEEIEENLGITGMITDEMIAEAQAKAEERIAIVQKDGESTAPAAETQPSGRSSEEIVADYTAQLYGVRGAFQGRVDGIIASAKEEYLALPSEEHTTANRNAIIYSKLGEAQAAEAECDAVVESILQELAADLTASGYSTAPVDELRGYYEEVKASQKAAYFSQLGG